MALILGKKDTRKINVIAEEPLDLAASKKHQFEVEFKLLSDAEKRELDDLVKSGEDSLAQDSIFGSIVGISGVKDEDGNDVPFSKELVTALRETSWTANALRTFFWGVQLGQTQQTMYDAIKRKN